MKSLCFDQLTEEDLSAIVDLQITELNTILDKHGFSVALTEEAKTWLIDKTCADRSYGARPLRRAIQKHVEDELSEAMIQGELEGVKRVEVYSDGDRLGLRMRTARRSPEVAPK